MPPELPIFGICGASGSGKTTLIEALLPRLISHGLCVAVAKLHAHGIDVDRVGKDSDRFFRAGGDVLLEGPEQGFIRTHPSNRAAPLRRLSEFARSYDLVLFEGRRRLECPKVWLLGEGESGPPADAGEVIATLGRSEDRVEAAWNILEEWLGRRWLKTPVYGCLLIGGGSTRMRRPKHLLEQDGRTWLERTLDRLSRVTERTVVAGAGEVPGELEDVTRLADAPGIQGPLAGMLSAMRWGPGASWLVTACDLPDLTVDALDWLLSTRAPGVWATVPRLPGRERVEPLLAHYDFRALALLEELACQGRFSPSLLAGQGKVISPAPPRELQSAWRNVNTPEDLESPGMQGE